ncbi:2-oxoacid ferredoxin oxidoreductase [compost metagenome]
MDASHYDAAVALASLPEKIRGFGHVRARSIEAICGAEQELLGALHRKVIRLKHAS